MRNDQLALKLLDRYFDRILEPMIGEAEVLLNHHSLTGASPHKNSALAWLGHAFNDVGWVPQARRGGVGHQADNGTVIVSSAALESRASASLCVAIRCGRHLDTAEEI